MKKNQLAKNIGHVVQLRPIPHRPTPNKDLNGIDDDWIIDSLSDEAAVLRNMRTGHKTLLSYDQIHSYMANPNRDAGQQKHGFLQLRVQISLLPDGLEVEPLPPGDWGGHALSEHPSQEPLRFSTSNDPELKRIIAHFKELGEEPRLPLSEDRDTNLLQGFRIAHYPGTNREIWVGYSRGRYEHLLMFKPSTGSPRETPDQKLQTLMPGLIAEMSTDLKGKPLIREFFVVSRRWAMNYQNLCFTYYLEDHESLINKIQILENYGFVIDVTPGNAKKYRMTENFVEYLLSL